MELSSIHLYSMVHGWQYPQGGCITFETFRTLQIGLTQQAQRDSTTTLVAFLKATVMDRHSILLDQRHSITTFMALLEVAIIGRAAATGCIFKSSVICASGNADLNWLQYLVVV